MCIQALPWQMEGVDGSLSLPAVPSLCQRAAGCFPNVPCQQPGSLPGREAALGVAAGQELSGMAVHEAAVPGKSSAPLSSSHCSAPRQESLLHLHLGIVFLEQEAFILLKCSSPMTFYLLHFLAAIENKQWTGRVLEGLCCHPELCLNGHCLLWAWFDFVLLKVFHFQAEFSPGNTGDVPELDGSAWQPLPYTIRLCSVTILGVQSSQPPSPVLWESSGVPGRWVLFHLCPSLRNRLCFLYVCHFSSSGTVVRPSPTSQGDWQFVY